MRQLCIFEVSEETLELPHRELMPVSHRVGQDQGERKEEQAEQKVPNKAVALPMGDCGWPERDGNPDDHTKNS
jgi:hypothetical protein